MASKLRQNVWVFQIMGQLIRRSKNKTDTALAWSHCLPGSQAGLPGMNKRACAPLCASCACVRVSRGRTYGRIMRVRVRLCVAAPERKRPSARVRLRAPARVRGHPHGGARGYLSLSRPRA